jgi:drug/metabolite transporter (DMT)-like permease
MAGRVILRRGISLALASAVLLGMMPIFGKQAISAGLPPLIVVATRTGGAAAMLFVVVLLFRRRYLYIYPLGLVGCFLAGGLNGLGSLLYYTGLARLDAGLAQLLYSFYPVFVAVVLYLDGQRHTPLTILRLALSLPAILLLTRSGPAPIDLTAALFLLAAGFLYALHIPINQRILYEAPAPTVTLYTLLAMTAVVIPACLVLSPHVPAVPAQAWAPVLGLTAITFLSRLTLFAGVKHIGGMQTSLLGLAELLVAISLAHLWLGETLSPSQWLGAGLLTLTLLLAGFDKRRGIIQHGRGWLHWLTPPEVVQPTPADRDSEPSSTGAR